MIIVQKHYKQLFNGANEFLVAHKAMHQHGSLNNAAFQLHQSTERFYCCILVVLSNYRPKTHDIERLRNMAIQHTHPNSPLPAIFAGKDRFQRRSFQRLKRAYIDARYSEHYEITPEELLWLAQETEKLKNSVNAICQSHIKAIANSI